MYTIHTICIRCVQHLHSVHIQCVCNVQMVYLLEIELARRANEFTQTVAHPKYHFNVTTVRHPKLVVVLVLIYTQNVSGRMRTQRMVLKANLCYVALSYVFLRK